MREDRMYTRARVRNEYMYKSSSARLDRSLAIARKRHHDKEAAAYDVDATQWLLKSKKPWVNKIGLGAAKVLGIAAAPKTQKLVKDLGSSSMYGAGFTLNTAKSAVLDGAVGVVENNTKYKRGKLMTAGLSDLANNPGRSVTPLTLALDKAPKVIKYISKVFKG